MSEAVSEGKGEGYDDRVKGLMHGLSPQGLEDEWIGNGYVDAAFCLGELPGDEPSQDAVVQARVRKGGGLDGRGFHATGIADREVHHEFAFDVRHAQHCGLITVADLAQMLVDDLGDLV